MSNMSTVQQMLRNALSLLGGVLIPFMRAEADCSWSAQWRNHSTKSERTFQLTSEKGAQFGIETDFLCIVSPVSVMNAPTNNSERALIKHIDMNCRYAEGERGMATGLAGIEADFAMEVVHFFLADQVGDTTHSITLKLLCEPVSPLTSDSSISQVTPSPSPQPHSGK
jgi:hypothetical protein